MNKMLSNYFENKVGQKIHIKYRTGSELFSEVFQRNYDLEVIGVDDEKVYFNIKSYDVVPSGYSKWGTDKDYGIISIRLHNKPKQVEDVIDSATFIADAEFFTNYCSTKI